MVTQRSVMFSGMVLGSVLALSVPAQAAPVSASPPRGGVVTHTVAPPRVASVGFARRVARGLLTGGRKGAERGAKHLGRVAMVGGAIAGPIALWTLLALSADSSSPSDRAAAPIGTAMLGPHAAFGGGFLGRRLGRGLGALGGAVVGGLGGAAKAAFSRGERPATPVPARGPHTAP